MKVLLTAFNGKLKSEVLDFPEGQPPKVKLRMDFDLPTWGYTDKSTSDTVVKTGEFVWDGKTTFVGNQEVKHYKLVDVL